MYRPGSYIHYSNDGLCRIEEIMTPDFATEKDKLYYRLTPVDERNRVTIYVPVDSEDGQMRKALSAEEADELIRSIPQIEQLHVKEEKKRETDYKEALRSADCVDWVRVIKTIYARRSDRLRAGKKMNATEERYLNSARDRLHRELSVAIGIPYAEVEDYISRRIG